MAHLQSPYSILIVNNQIFMYIGLGNLDQCLLSSNHRHPAHLCGTDVIVILPMNYRPYLSAWFWVYFSACSLCLCPSPSFPASTLWFPYAEHLLCGGQAQSFLYLWKPPTPCHPVMFTRNLSQKNKLSLWYELLTTMLNPPTYILEDRHVKVVLKQLGTGNQKNPNCSFLTPLETRKRTENQPIISRHSLKIYVYFIYINVLLAYMYV